MFDGFKSFRRSKSCRNSGCKLTRPMQKLYILLTAAKNEEAYITKTIESVLRQTVLPVAWFIMDDGSTDRMAAIIESFAAKHPFIRLISPAHGKGATLVPNTRRCKPPMSWLGRWNLISLECRTPILRPNGKIITKRFSGSLSGIRVWASLAA